MKYRYFFIYNLIGGLLWAVGVTLTGYYLGRTIPGIDKYLIPIIIAIILITSSPTIIHIARDKALRERIIKYTEKLFHH